MQMRKYDWLREFYDYWIEDISIPDPGRDVHMRIAFADGHVTTLIFLNVVEFNRLITNKHAVKPRSLSFENIGYVWVSSASLESFAIEPVRIEAFDGLTIDGVKIEISTNLFGFRIVCEDCAAVESTASASENS